MENTLPVLLKSRYGRPMLWRESSLLLLPTDRIDRADLVACSTLDAGVHINYVDRISFSDGCDRTDRFAGATCYAIVSNEMSTHDCLLFVLLASCQINSTTVFDKFVELFHVRSPCPGETSARAFFTILPLFSPMTSRRKSLSAVHCILYWTVILFFQIFIRSDFFSVQLQFAAFQSSDHVIEPLIVRLRKKSRQ